MYAIAKYPATNPNAICKYPKAEAFTIPGTEMNVTPDIDVPIIAMATTYHGDCLPPVKNCLESAFFLVVI